MKFDLSRVHKPSFFFSLGFTTIAYFAAVRLFQDWLYHAMGIDVRPLDMFLSFGPKFSQAEPLEIVLYLLGYIVVPMVAYFIAPFIDKITMSLRGFVKPASTDPSRQRQAEADASQGGQSTNVDPRITHPATHFSQEMERKASIAALRSPSLDSSRRGGRSFAMTVGFIGLIIIGVLLLKFPFGRFIEYVQTNTIGHVLWFAATKRIIVTYLLLGVSAVFFAGYYLFNSRRAPPLTPPNPRGDTGGVDLRNGKWEKYFKRFWPLGLIVLIILIFNPNFPIDDHHSNYFVGSVHEVYQGKALLYESSNLYGLFSIYFLLAMFKLIPLTFTSFTAVIMAVYVVFFSGLWMFVRKWLNSRAHATLALIPIVAIMYFFQTSPTRSALFLPAMSPFRWGLYVIVLFLLLGYERTRKGEYLHWSLFVAAFSLFWNFDSGLFLSAATLGTMGYIALCHSVLDTESKQEDKQKQTVIASEVPIRIGTSVARFAGAPARRAISEDAQNEIARLDSMARQASQTRNDNSFSFGFLDSQSKLGMTIRRMVGVIVEYLVYIIGLFAVTSAVNRLIYGSWPHWELFFRESKYFSTGIAMYPLPKFGVFEILFFVYAVVLIIAFARMVRDRKLLNIPLVFLALYGVFSFIYYIGESSWQILYVVVVPFVLICAYGYRQCISRYPELDSGSRNQKQTEKELSSPTAIGDPEIKIKQQKDSNSFGVSFGFLDSMSEHGITYCRIIRSGFATIIFFGVVLLAFKLPVEFTVRDYSGIGERFVSIDPFDQGTFDDAQYLQQYYPQHRIPIMSLNDTKLMMYSGKVNAFDFYYIFTIYFKSEMQKYVDQVLREQQRYIVVGRGEYRNDQVEYFLDGIDDEHRLKESLKTVEVYERK